MSKIINLRDHRRRRYQDEGPDVARMMADTAEGARLRLEAATLMIRALKGELVIQPVATVDPRVQEGLDVLQTGDIGAFFGWLGRDAAGPGGTRG